MSKIFKKELFWLGIVFILFLIIRSIYYVDHLNFSGDQATHSAIAMKLWQDKKITLIGPPTSMKLGLREFYMGPITYYLQMLFLLPTNFEPIAASYLFTIFCGLMIFPLYFGLKKLVSLRAAWIVTIIYSFSLYYLEYTRFLWNPTFQLSFIPILIYIMARFKTNKKILTFLLLSIFLGLILQFHYQFVLIIFGLIIYYFLIQKLPIKYLAILFLGIMIGFSPIIIFELRNNFYNTNTIILFLRNWDQVDKPGGQFTPHYYLATTFFILVATLAFFKKNIDIISAKSFKYLIVILSVVLLFFSLKANIVRTTSSYWSSAPNWNYMADYKIYEIIKSSNIKNNYNVANLVYDAKAVVVKYLLKRDKVDINYDDYYGNKYLFVISKPGKYEKDPAYEVDFFKPRKLLQTWKINDYYEMYLLERLPKN